MDVKNIPNPEQEFASVGGANLSIGWFIGWRVGWRIGWWTGWWNPFDYLERVDPREIGRVVVAQGEFLTKMGPLEADYMVKQGELIQEMGRRIAEVRGGK